MKTQKYSVNQHLIETILAWVRSGEIAIPEIQRPFLWESSKVRDLLDSLYQGYPIGYLIAWRNPNVRLKDGTSSEGKKILIDGQQRVMALPLLRFGRSISKKTLRTMIFMTRSLHYGLPTEYGKIMLKEFQKNLLVIKMGYIWKCGIRSTDGII